MQIPRPKIVIVGPPWEQTRLAGIIMIIGTVICLAILAYLNIYGGIINDNKFAATVYWTKYGYSFQFWGQNNDLFAITNGVARGYYQINNLNGFSKFEVETSSSGYSEQVQAKATGLLEGYLMWKSIHQIWQNTIGDYCKFNGDKCSLIRGYLIDNKNWILEQVEQHQNQTDYIQWKQISLFYYHIEGIEKGLRYALKRNQLTTYKDIAYSDFLWMNAFSDLEDNKSAFNASFVNRFKIPSVMFLNYSKTHQLNIVHGKKGPYQSMRRVLKHYKTDDLSIQFTSYPGCISSQDDLYVLKRNSSTLVIASAEFFHKNDTNLYRFDNFLLSPRVMMANKLSRDADQWFNNFNKFQSNQGRKVWTIVDINKLKSMRDDWFFVYNGTDQQNVPVEQFWTNFNNKTILDFKITDLDSLIKFVENLTNSVSDKSHGPIDFKLFSIDLESESEDFEVIFGPTKNQISDDTTVRNLKTDNISTSMQPNSIFHNVLIDFQILKIHFVYDFLNF